MTQKINLTPRLLAAAETVRPGSFIADIGTDHAYLPIYLCLNGKIRGGVASDINEGPVKRGALHIKNYGLDKKLSTLKTDGLIGIEKYAPDDIFILGMGGELIARIIADAPWTKNPRIRLCLQPMTHAEVLRAFLLENGYGIIDERLAKEDERIYQLISAEYCGYTESYTQIELLLGKINIQKRTNELIQLAEKTLSVYTRRLEGKRLSGDSTAEEELIISAIQSILKETP